MTAMKMRMVEGTRMMKMMMRATMTRRATMIRRKTNLIMNKVRIKYLDKV